MKLLILFVTLFAGTVVFFAAIASDCFAKKNIPKPPINLSPSGD